MSLLVSTTTDDQAVVDAVAAGDEEGARVPAVRPESQKLDGSSTVSFEHPRSERQLYLERLAQHEADLDSLTAPEDSERISSSEPSESGDIGEPEAEAEAEPGDIDMAEVRRAATQDAIAEARRRMVASRQETYTDWQAEHFAPSAEAQVNQLREKLLPDFKSRIHQLAEKSELEQLAKAERVGVETGKLPLLSPVLTDALLSNPGGPEATVYLLRHPEERARLAAIPDPVAVWQQVGELSARLTARPTRARSAAPAPIRPVGGSSTKSSVPLDQTDYQEYRRIRDAQEKSRFRR